MTSEVQICNQALTSLGAETITSLGDDTNEAKLCNLHYASLRDAIQTENDWTFCTFWEKLAQVSPTPLSEFANAYALPNNTLRVLFVGQDYQNREHYRVEQNLVFTDAVSAKAQLIRRVEDVSVWSPLFRQALIARLAAELAIPITNSRSLAEQHYAIYDDKLSRAQSMDGAQGRPRRIRSTWLQGSRTRGPWAAGPYV